MILFKTLQKTDGVSPAIGAILVVVMVIILSVAISGYILGITDIDKDAQAGVSVEHNPGSSFVIQLTNLRTAEKVEVKYQEETDLIPNTNNPLSEVGSTMIVEGPNYKEGYTVQIIGVTPNGDKTVIRTIEL